MIKYWTIAAIVCSGLFWSCDDEELPPKNSLVLEGYLFADAPINRVKLSRLGGFGEEVENIPVNNAAVFIFSNGQGVLLENLPGNEGRYHYPNNDFQIIEGQRYDIWVLHQEDTLFGSTLVPPKPIGLVGTSSELMVNDATTINTFWERNHTWWSPVIVSLEENADRVPQDTEFRFSFSIPSTNNFFEIDRTRVTYFGDNAFVVYSVNDEYVKLFDADNPENFFETPSNVVNGFGIFTAFNSDSLYFEVLP